MIDLTAFGIHFTKAFGNVPILLRDFDEISTQDRFNRGRLV